MRRRNSGTVGPFSALSSRIVETDVPVFAKVALAFDTVAPSGPETGKFTVNSGKSRAVFEDAGKYSENGYFWTKVSREENARASGMVPFPEAN